MKFISSSILALTTVAVRSVGAFVPHAHTAAPTRILSSLASTKLPVMAEESIMSQKTHGTSEKPVQKNLRWNCDYETADRICKSIDQYVFWKVEHASQLLLTNFIIDLLFYLL